MDRHGLLRPAGIVQITDFEGAMREADTNQCVHCGGHWVARKGSGRPHVFCRKCGGDTCSQLRCLTECAPIEKRFDIIERDERNFRMPEATDGRAILGSP